jgi:hypothetical protein
VAAQLVVFFKTPNTFHSDDDPRKDVILTIAYVALILSIGATIGSLVLTDEFADIPIRAARSPDNLGTSETKQNRTFLGTDWKMMEEFGLRKSTRLVVSHCESSSRCRCRCVRVGDWFQGYYRFYFPVFSQQYPLSSMPPYKNVEGQWP